jgi:hypothetical protein
MKWARLYRDEVEAQKLVVFSAFGLLADTLLR